MGMCARPRRKHPVHIPIHGPSTGSIQRLGCRLRARPRCYRAVLGAGLPCGFAPRHIGSGAQHRVFNWNPSAAAADRRGARIARASYLTHSATLGLASRLATLHGLLCEVGAVEERCRWCGEIPPVDACIRPLAHSSGIQGIEVTPRLVALAALELAIQASEGGTCQRGLRKHAGHTGGDNAARETARPSRHPSCSRVSRGADTCGGKGRRDGSELPRRVEGAVRTTQRSADPAGPST